MSTPGFFEKSPVFLVISDFMKTKSLIKKQEKTSRKKSRFLPNMRFSVKIAQNYCPLFKNTSRQFL